MGWGGIGRLPPVLWVGWTLTAGAAAVDWWAVAGDRRRVESVAKPMVMVGLIVTTLVAGTAPDGMAPWIVTALVAGMIGDVLLLPRINRFVGGLVAFLLGHVAYLVAFGMRLESVAGTVVGAAIAIVLLVAFGRPIAASVSTSRLAWPVRVYLVVVIAVVVAGGATGSAAIAVGAALFATSDGVLGRARFVSRTPQRRLLVHVLYHVGQAAIVAGAIGSIA